MVYRFQCYTYETRALPGALKLVPLRRLRVLFSLSPSQWLIPTDRPSSLSLELFSNSTPLLNWRKRPGADIEQFISALLLELNCTLCENAN